MEMDWSPSLWLRQARVIIETLCGPQRGDTHVTIRSDSGAKVDLSLPAEDAAIITDPHFSPIEREIITALGSEVMVGKRIASRCSRPFNTHFKTILANLVDRQILERTPEGYRVAPT